MIKFISIALTVFLCSLPVWSICLAADISVETGLSYEWWDSDGDENGSQFAIPLEAELTREDFSCRLITGYVNTESKTNTLDSSLSSLVDTKLNLSYQWLDLFPVDILVGLDFNLPTGKTDLSTTEIDLIVDPELVSITPFGEGIAVNPTLIVAKSWQKIAVGFGAGYAWRGEYDFSESLKDYDPGEILSLTGELRFGLSPDWQLKGYAEYSSFGEDEKNGKVVRENGDLAIVGLGANGESGPWSFSVDLHSAFRSKTQIYDKKVLIRSKQSSGDEWAGSMSLGYSYDHGTLIKATTSVLSIAENDDATGEKEKFALEVELIKEITSRIKGTAKLNGFHMDSGKDWFHDQDIKIKGVSAMIGISSRF